MLKNKKVERLTMIGFICLIVGLVSFRNHPDWGDWLAGLGGLLVVISVIISRSKEYENKIGV